MPLPLSYGVPEIGKSGFIDTLQPPSQVEPPVRRAPNDDLGDFVSFDDLPPMAPTARPAHQLSSGSSAPVSPGAMARAPSAWCTSRRYNGTAPLLLLHEELLDFWHAFRPTHGERAARVDLVRRMSDVVHSVWPSARVQPFGSYETGLYLPESDVDLICLGTGVGSSGKHRGAALHRLAAALRRADWSVIEMEVVDKARVPIIKFVDGTSGVSVDVCLEEETGLQSSELARRASRQFPAFGVMVVVLKRFLNSRGLHDTFTGGVGSFLLQLMIIASLQHPPPESVSRHAGAAPRGNLASALLHFFEMFGLRLNYESVGVSVRDGGKFFNKRHRASKQSYGREKPGQMLCILNPLDASHDVGANSYNFHHVRRVFQHAYFALLSSLDTTQGEHGAASGAAAGGAAAGGAAAGGAAAGGAAGLRVLDGLLYGLEEEMSARFAEHARDRNKGGGVVAAAPVPAPALEAVDKLKKRQQEKRVTDVVDIDDDDDEDDDDDDGDESESEAEAVAVDRSSELFSLRAARTATPPERGQGVAGGKKRGRGGAGDDPVDVVILGDPDGGRSEHAGRAADAKRARRHTPREVSSEEEHDDEADAPRATGVHPREMTRKQRREQKKIKRQNARGARAPGPARDDRDGGDEARGKGTRGLSKAQRRFAGSRLEALPGKQKGKAQTKGKQGGAQQAALVGIGKAPRPKKQRKGR